jgi:hypothetical protein
LIHANEFKTLAAYGDEVEAPIGIFFDDRHNFGGASHLDEAPLKGTYDAESLVPGEAFADHLFVAGLENVQRQRCAGEQDNVEREEGDQRGQVNLQRQAALYDCTLTVKSDRVAGNFVIDWDRGGE